MRKKVHKVIFAGAGPGACDLITIRALDAIKDADLIIYAGSLVNPKLLNFAKKNCIIYDSAKMNLNQIICEISKAYSNGKKIIRLHTGDPSVYGAIAEQMLELDKLKIPYEIIPGVSSVFAAAAELKTELTSPGVSQTVILTRTAGRTPVPHGQELQNLAKHKATLALFLSAPLIDQTAEELIRGGYSKNTSVAAVYKASWKEQKIIRGTLANIANKLKKAKIDRQTIIFIGDVLDKKKWQYSCLYSPKFSHKFREISAADNSQNQNAVTEETLSPRFQGKVAIYALTSIAFETAKRIIEKRTNWTIFTNQKFIKTEKNIYQIQKNKFDELIKENWEKFDGHIFISAAGIVVRHIACLLKNKTVDPAVVVCDQYGNYAVSLLSGHIGGANRLAEETAQILSGQAVITTASDSLGLISFDEIAAREGYVVSNPSAIKALNSSLIKGEKIAANIPFNLYKKYYVNQKNVVFVKSLANFKTAKFQAAVSVAQNADKNLKIPLLILKKAKE